MRGTVSVSPGRRNLHQGLQLAAAVAARSGHRLSPKRGATGGLEGSASNGEMLVDAADTRVT
jgi:hypothetical protein